MKKIKFLILTFTFCMVNCNNKVPILRYNIIDDCPNCECTIGIPIQTKSPLREFTFCGKYRFKYLKDVVMMYMDPPVTYIRIMDYEDRVGILKHDAAGYFFFFPNQNLKPDSWQHVCLSVSLDSMRLVLNGEVVFDSPPNSVMEDITASTLWIGGENIPQLMHRRVHGTITDVYLWKEFLKIEDLISITTSSKSRQSKSISAPVLFSWDKFETAISSSCLEYETLNENDKLFIENFQEKDTLLVEHQANFATSRNLCQALGGDLLVPKNDYQFGRVADLLKQSDSCRSTFIGLKKLSNKQLVDQNGNPIQFAKWAFNEPNGKDYEQCVVMYDANGYNDGNCGSKNCFSCQMSPKNIYSLRGQIPPSMDRKYFVGMTGKEIEIRGIKQTECIWRNKSWYFGTNYKQDFDQPIGSNMPPIGLQTWNNGEKLKFTQCNEDEFTCNSYGNCVPMSERCDGQQNCIDGSDELGCTIMTLQEGYDRKYPSDKNITVSLSMNIYDILDIQEIHMQYKVFLRVELLWYDPRITFRNLKPKKDDNQLNANEIDQIWSPQLKFLNSDEIGVIIAGEQGSSGDLSKFSGKGSVSIRRDGNHQLNPLDELNEDYLYPGKDNPIIMTNSIVVRLGCKFHLKM